MHGLGCWGGGIVVSALLGYGQSGRVGIWVWKLVDSTGFGSGGVGTGIDRVAIAKREI